jgi:UDP-N-acetylmuramoylalanine--D-glutamate ligase
MIEVTDKNVLVLGAGKSGVSAARFAKKLGAQKVILSDVKSRAKLDEAALSIEKEGILLETDGHKNDSVLGADIIIISPGIALRGEWYDMAKRHDKFITGEVEFAYRFMDKSAVVIGITGTNGKTTATSLMYEILKAHFGERAAMAGNIGIPFCDVVSDRKGYTHIVLEISSFQLETIKDFRPHVASILNITDDHLDRYDNMQAYAEAKARIFLNQFPEDVLILRKEDKFTDIMASMSRSRKVFFSANGEYDECYFTEAGAYYKKTGGKREKLFSAEGIQLVGKHNAENILSCVITADVLGLDMRVTETAVKAFKALAHRIEFVAETAGKKYYDDSKGTNIDAVIKAVDSFTEDTALILGGREKNTDFYQLKRVLPANVKKIIALGENRDKIEGVFGDRLEVVKCASMEEAVAASLPMDVKIVLLSPGCASFDLFKNYAHRGDEFKKYVLKAAKNV